MTIIAPTHASSLLHLLGERLDADGLRLLALQTCQYHREILPEQLPARPAAIALSDDELIDAASDMESGEKVGADRRRQLTYFGAWRYAVWVVEAQNSKRLCTLLDAALTLTDSGDREQADALWSHAVEVWRVRQSEVPTGLVWWQLRDWCIWRSQALGVLPTHLRSMRRRRGGIPVAPSGPTPAWTDPEREQEALRW